MKKAAPALPPWLRQGHEGALLLVHAVPRASRTEFCGEHDGRLKIKVQAPPVEGAANNNIKKFLAKKFHLPKKSIELTSGARSRQKAFLLRGISVNQVLSVVST